MSSSPSPSSSSPSPSRRRVLAALGAVGVGSVGVAGYAGTVTVPHLSPVWERWRTDTAESGAVGVAAAAAGGRLFLTRGNRLAALDPATGDRLWTRHVADRLHFGIVAGADAVYAGDDELAAVGFDGAERWRVSLSDRAAFPDDAALDCTPAVAGDRVFLSVRTHLAALDAADGSVAWATPLGDWSVESLAAAGGTLFVGLGNRGENHGLVRAVRTSDGARRWQVRVSDRRIDFATGDALYCAVGRRGGAGGTGVVAFDPTDGRRLWTYDLVHVNGVTVRDERVYAVAGRGGFGAADAVAPAGAVVALDAVTGAERWRTPATDYGRSAPAVTDDRVYVSSPVTGGTRRLGEGAVVAYDAGGDHLWTRPAGAGNQPIPSPLVRDGSVCVVGDEAAFALTERGW